MSLVKEAGDVLEYTAILEGRINGEEIVVNGNGKIHSRQGLTQGKYNLQILPQGFSPFFLGAVLITGYPNACAPIEDCRNVFQGGSYQYSRTLSFGNAGSLSITADCRLESSLLSSKFTVQGELVGAALRSIEPLVEVWEPVGEQEVDGHFKIFWRSETGSLLSANAHSHYHVTESTSGMPLLHRYIDIESLVEEQHLFLTQRSVLFNHIKNRV